MSRNADGVGCQLRNADGGGVCQIFRKNALGWCKVHSYLRYEGVGGGPISTWVVLRLVCPLTV